MSVNNRLENKVIAGSTDVQGSVVAPNINSVSLKYVDTIQGLKGGLVETVSDNDSVVVKKFNKDKSGTWDWTTMIVGAKNGIDVSNDILDNTYAMGTYNSPVFFYNATGILAFTLPQPKNISVYLGKINRVGNWQWVARINGGINELKGICLKTDSENNTYVSLNTISRSIVFYNFDGSPGLNKSIGSNTGTKMLSLIAKIDYKGKWLWCASMYGVNYTVCDSYMAIDNQQNIYVNGIFNGGVNFYNPNNILQSDIVTSRLNDVFIAKLDTNGQWSWSSYISSATDDTNSKLIVDCNNNCYVSCESQSTEINFYNSNNLLSTTIHKSGMYLGKISPNGFWIWISYIESINDVYPISIALNQDNNGYILGRYHNNLIFYNANNLSNLYKTAPFKPSNFIAKFDKDGNWIWCASITNNDPNTLYADDIVISRKNKVYVSGTYSKSAIFNNSDDSNNLNINDASNLSKVFIAQIDDNGFWKLTYKIEGNVDNSSVSMDQHSNIYTTGEYTNSPITFYGSDNSINLKKNTPGPGCYVAKINTSDNGIIGFLKNNIVSGKVVEVILC
jgi:hypothetical protein